MAARLVEGSPGGPVPAVRRPAAPAAGVRPWLRHPVAAWEASGRRWLPGAWYPLAVWAFWRVLQLLLSVYLGGPQRMYTALNAAFYYDGERYLEITRHGYLLASQQMPNTAFFPGVSWVAWPVWRLTGSELLTGHITATLTGALAFVCVWGAAAAWTDDALARRAVWLLALFPSSMFLWAFYSEGLFILLGAGAVWADRRDRRVLAALCLFGLSTTRSVGVLGALVLAAARLARRRPGADGRPVRGPDRWVAVYAAAGAAGLVPVLVMMRHYTGDPLAFVSVQADWGRALSPPWATLANGVASLWPDPATIMVPALVARNFDLWCLPVVAVAIAWLVLAPAPVDRARRSARPAAGGVVPAAGADPPGAGAGRRPRRFPAEGWALGVALIALPLCSTSLASFNRFVMADWVIYPAWASLLGRVPAPWRRLAWLAVVVALAVTTYHLVGRFSVDRFVG